jgi:hypothetical protein
LPTSTTDWKDVTWQQFGAAIDMLQNAICACPDSVWCDRTQKPEFWYLVYHTLFFLDYYLSESAAGFAPPAPFTLSELDPAGVMPDRAYSQAELLAYLKHGRDKARRRMAAMTEQETFQDSGFAGRDMSVAELLIYNMRHVQYHAAQLNLILRQTTRSAPGWVSRAAAPL